MLNTSILTPHSDVKHRDDIDGLRGIAVLLVVVYHFRFFAGADVGFMGVDLFFVISGFVITGLLIRDGESGVLSLRKFYVNRIRRLAPAFFVSMFMGVAAASLILLPNDFKELSRQLSYSILYASNFYFWRNINYFGLNIDDVYLVHTWSLSIEEQFYLLYPIAFVFAIQFARKQFWMVFAGTLIASFALNVYFVPTKPEAVFYLLPTRAWELLYGGLLHKVHTALKRSRRTDELCGILGLILLTGALISFSVERAYPGYFALLPTSAAALILLSGMQTTTLTTRLLGVGPLSYIGRVSYPLYLVHWPVYTLFREYLQEDFNIRWKLASCTFAFLSAVVIYHLVENPIRRKRWFAADKSILRGYLACLSASAIAIGLVQVTHGLPARFPERVSEVASFVNDRPAPMLECQPTMLDPALAGKYCVLGTSTIVPTWLVFGDSHAWALTPALDLWLRQRGESALFAFKHSCPPLVGIHSVGDRGACNRFNTATLEYLKHDATIKNVILVSAWRQAIEGRLSTSPSKSLTNDESVQLFSSAFSSTVQTLNAWQKNVYIWEPVPGARRDVPQALALAAMGRRQNVLEFSLSEYRSEYSFFFLALGANEKYIKHSFSPSRALCASGSCAVVIDGIPAYWDNNHMSRSVAEYISKTILEH